MPRTEAVALLLAVVRLLVVVVVRASHRARARR